VSVVVTLPCKPCSTSSLLGSLVAATETLTIPLNSNVQIVNYLDLQGDLIVDGIFGVQ
jgi:hypothetical protein